MTKSAATNPFYILLVITGMLFVITAFAFCTMAVREAEGTEAVSHGLTALLARYGTKLLIGELILLAVATIGAITTEDFWNRRTARPSDFAAKDGTDVTKGRM
jgi:hypothetical protein